jgi:NADP-dependent 3-hydroxy acid dehydrogenase YdfG
MNPIYDFRGQVALVTGASSGMGLATARAFAEAGAAVVLADRKEEALQAAVDAMTDKGHRAVGALGAKSGLDATRINPECKRRQ